MVGIRYVSSHAQSGMQCSTEVKESAVSGLGLFAKEAIKKGAVVWMSIPGTSVEVLDRKQVQVSRKPIESYLFYRFLGREQTGCSEYKKSQKVISQTLISMGKRISTPN